MAALVYEVVWIHKFSIAFGNTAQAMSTVLTVYLGGLAAGSWAARRGVRLGAGSALRWYGVTEVMTGLWALLVPWLTSSAEPLLAGMYRDEHGAIVPLVVARAALGSMALFPAVFCMGATLPLVAARVGDAIRSLYALNLACATAGAFMAGFVFLPVWGYRSTALAASGLNMVVGIAAMLARGSMRSLR